MKNMNKVNLMKVFGLVVFLFVFGVGIAQAAPKKEPKIVVGANLKEYKQPNKKQCDINVPKQYPTIQAGVDAAVAGDTVCVGAGTYNEDVSVNKPIRLSGNGFANPSIINHNSVAYKGYYYTVYVGARDVTVEGFVINGARDGVGAWGGIYNSAILISPDVVVDNATIQYNRVIAGDGSMVLISFAGANDSSSVQNNVFVGDNSSHIVFYQGDMANLNFTHNTLLGTVYNGGRPDQAIEFSSSAYNTVAEYNLFAASGSSYSITLGCREMPYSIRYNNFNSTAPIKVGVCQGSVNAENNWWGDTDPSDNIQGNVDFTPFATKPFEQYHAKINKQK